MPSLADVRLIDAHSFCWLLVRRELEPADELYIGSAKGRASNAKKLDAMEVSIFDMAYQAAATAATSNGQQVLVIKKNKDHVSPDIEGGIRPTMPPFRFLIYALTETGCGGSGGMTASTSAKFVPRCSLRWLRRPLATEIAF